MITVTVTGAARTHMALLGWCQDGEACKEKAYRKEAKGFTLVEVLVAATMMFAMLFALYAIFDVSVRAFGYGGDRLEAIGNARLALEQDGT